MEKLQQALQKARRQRGTDEPRRTAARPTGTTSVDELWANLQDFVPDEKLLMRNRIISYNSGHSFSAMDALRTKTLLHMRKNKWRRLAITSATADCGKTTTVCNIALGMTRQPSLRTVLFDADLRNPSIAQTLGTQPAHDITDLLNGTVPFENQAVRIRNNLAVCMAGRRTTDPMRYLMSNEANEVLQEIERRYKPDLMLFDLPPLVIGGDTPGFLTNVDCALIVARAEKTTVKDIDKCEREIAEHTNVLGVVLNQCRYSDDAAGNYEYGL